MKKTIFSLAMLLATGSVAFGQTTPPYTQDFYATADFNKMTLIDANEDGNTWAYASYDPVSWSSSARYTGATENAADDWMITEALELKAGYVYNFSLYAIGVTGYTNNVDVMLGTEPNATAMTTKIVDTIVLTEKAKNSYTGVIEVEKDGTYYIGIHVTAEANQGAIYIDDIKVESGIIANAPAAVSALTASAAVADAKAVMNLSFVAPATTNSGAELTAISNIAIYRGTEKIADLGEQTPGATITYTDLTPAKGSNTYKVICSNEAGEGSEATVTAYVNYSYPAAPTNVVFTSTTEGQSITWDAVTTPSGTGLFIPENVTYKVTRSDNVVIAEGLTECNATDNYSREGEGQDLISYTVIAVNEAGNSTAGTSNKILIGNPYTGEYAESFAGYKYTTSTWQIVGGSSTMWTTTSSTYYSPAISAAQDGDNGFAKFYNYSKGATQRLVSPIINVSDMQNPRLSFYLYQDAACSYNEMLIPEILVDGTYTPLNEGITVKGETTGWVKFNIDLNKELVSKDFQLSFQGVADYGYNVAIDNITITDALPYNLAVVEVKGPKSMAIGKEDNIAVNIKNTGVNIASGYSVVLSLNGNPIQTIEGADLASEATADIVFNYTPLPFQSGLTLNFAAEIVYEKDLNADDNNGSISIEVAENALPTPTELQALNNETSILLNWTAPVVPEVDVQPVSTESFEEWETNTTTGINGWTFVDVDGLNSAGFSSANTQSPLAFMIGEYYGAKVLISPKNYSWRDYRNDWAISPEVVGGQTVTFKACQYNGYGYYGTTFYFCYSTSDNNPNSFVVLGDAIVDKSSSWKEYSFTLPEDAKYFAIHVVDDGSSTSDALLIDDVTFQPGSVQLVHTGYNIYRNNELITSISDIATTSYEDDEIVKDTEYEYAVSALYENGESKLSNIATVKCTVGIESAINDEAAIYATQNSIVVNGYVGQTLNIYTAAGVLVDKKVIADDKTIVALQPGLYIVNIAGNSQKAVIR
ncbi:MAG: choice-of-anchor J domain-containing protein [Muribaculaceae bacterium]|nr:choice-of-anchor J domain-containing protein [Muribaculaceae bacterium]